MFEATHELSDTLNMLIWMTTQSLLKPTWGRSAQSTPVESARKR